ncbi:hypothetical protein C8J57DRAFT_1673692 [Mycena rebaudengoi]|nr:hypothetical protein C8J57DRAFT_1673692 [Mycena rebaudengoi]
MTQQREHEPTHLPKHPEYIRITSFWYDIRFPNNIQTFPIDPEIRSLGIDFGVVVLMIKSNWAYLAMWWVLLPLWEIFVDWRDISFQEEGFWGLWVGGTICDMAHPVGVECELPAILEHIDRGLGIPVQ